MFRELWEIVFPPYRPEENAIIAPTGEKVAKNKVSNKVDFEDAPGLEIDIDTGLVYKKEETQGNVDASWSLSTKEKKGKIIAPGLTKKEVHAVGDSGLNLEMYKELRPHFYKGLSLRAIEKSYAKRKVSGFSRTKINPYQQVFSKNRPKPSLVKAKDS